MIPAILLGLALLGLLVSVAAHALSFLGVALVREHSAITLHFGMLILGVAAAASVSATVSRCASGTRVFWRRHLPAWMRMVWLILFVNGFATIGWAIWSKFSGEKALDEMAGRAMANRIFGAGWMFLYAMLAGLFYAVFDCHRKGSERADRDE